MKTRLLTSAYIVIGLILAFLSRMLTPYIFDIVIGVLAVIGAVEVGRAMERSRNFNTGYLVGAFPAVLYIGFIFAFEYNWPWQYYLLLIISLMLLFFVLSYLLTICLKKETKRELNKYQVNESISKYAFKKAMNTSFILIYPCLLFACLFILNHIMYLPIGEILKDSPFDYYILISVFMVTMITDSLAMIVGSLVKGPKLCPRISPKKTISGAVGGLAGGVLSAFVVYWIFAINPNFVKVFNQIASLWTVALIGLIGSVISQFGDIFASFIKRRAFVKDYGTIFPGHGGVMDRVDGLIWNAAFMLIIVLILL